MPDSVGRAPSWPRDLTMVEGVYGRFVLWCWECASAGLAEVPLIDAQSAVPGEGGHGSSTSSGPYLTSDLRAQEGTFPLLLLPMSALTLLQSVGPMFIV